MDKEKENNRLTLYNRARQDGARLFGIADLRQYDRKVASELGPVWGRLSAAVCMAVELSQGVLETVDCQPNLVYSWHYRQANTRLDGLAFSLSRFIQEQGYIALPVAASQTVD